LKKKRPQNITAIVKRYLINGTVEYRKPTGRPSSVSSAKIAAIERNINRNPNLSVRAGAQKVGLAKSTYDRIKIKLGFKAYRKETSPKYNEKQERRVKTNCRKLYEKRFRNKTLLLDDETYCLINPEQIPGVEHYHCRNKSDVEDHQRFNSKEKFPGKYMVWQCLDEDGNASQPWVTNKTMNGDRYLEECLKKRLLPFIKKYHRVQDVCLWMDLAACHYKKEVLEWLRDNGIDFVGKTENAPNVPQARPIEAFWALCKRKYKARGQAAKSLRSFAKIWNNISKKVAKESGKALMEKARRNLRLIGRGGVREPFKQRNR
jgi:hypothetical protein